MLSIDGSDGVVEDGGGGSSGHAGNGCDFAKGI
jgi:hypothetical protein